MLIRVLFSLILILSASNLLSAQEGPSPDQVAKMKKLDWMVGTWQGDSWVIVGKGEKKELVQTENVRRELNGIILTIHGVGQKNGENVFEAFAVLNYDMNSQEYKMVAYRANGKSVPASAHFEEDGRFIWGFKIPNYGQVKYTLVQTEKGQWHEFGEFSRDGGKSWVKNFEMILSKQENKK